MSDNCADPHFGSRKIRDLVGLKYYVLYLVNTIGSIRFKKFAKGFNEFFFLVPFMKLDIYTVCHKILRFFKTNYILG